MWGQMATVTTGGEVLFEVEDTPRLLAVDPETGAPFFAHPNHDFESHWWVGQISDEVLPCDRALRQHLQKLLKSFFNRQPGDWFERSPERSFAERRLHRLDRQ